MVEYARSVFSRGARLCSVAWRCGLLVVALFPGLRGTAAHAQDAGGVLDLSQYATVDAQSGKQTRVSVALKQYSGPVMTTCQFRIVTKCSVHLSRVDAGADLPASRGWTVSSALRPAKSPAAGTYADTAIVVFYGPGLGPGTYNNLISVSFEASGRTLTDGTVALSKILGADAVGDDVNLHGGLTLTLAPVK